MRWPRLHGAHGGDQRLADYLATEYALPAHLRTAAAEQIHVEPLQVEKIEQILDGGGGEVMGAAGMGQILPPTCYAGPSFTRKAAKNTRMSKALKHNHIKPTW